MFEVYDINDGLTMHRFRKKAEADRCRRDMNKGKLDKLYAVRPAAGSLATERALDAVQADSDFRAK